MAFVVVASIRKAGHPMHCHCCPPWAEVWGPFETESDADAVRERLEKEYREETDFTWAHEEMEFNTCRMQPRDAPLYPKQVNGE